MKRAEVQSGMSNRAGNCLAGSSDVEERRMSNTRVIGTILAMSRGGWSGVRWNDREEEADEVGRRGKEELRQTANVWADVEVADFGQPCGNLRVWPEGPKPTLMSAMDSMACVALNSAAHFCAPKEGRERQSDQG